MFLVVFWRVRYKLSLRDLAEMFLIRGIVFTHEAVRDWEAKLAPLLSEGLRKRGAFQPASGDAFTQAYDRRTSTNWVDFLGEVEAGIDPAVERIYAVVDNLITHSVPDVLLFSLLHPRSRVRLPAQKCAGCSSILMGCSRSTKFFIAAQNPSEIRFIGITLVLLSH
jgi:hypothetical protein